MAFYDGLADWVDEERAVGVVYLDFSKAYETLSHNILLVQCGLGKGDWGVAEWQSSGVVGQSLVGGL